VDNENSQPFDDWKIPLYKVYTDDEDLNLITKIIKRGSQWALGPEIEQFENMIKNYVGCDYCLTLNSGTSSLHAAYLAYGFKPHDEIIVPSFSFISTANSVLFVGATPKFADIEPTNFGLDPSLLPSIITSKTKAIIPMDYGGVSCQINEIKKIADENDLLVIEDAAEALGTSVNGIKTGNMSDLSIFSFCGNKVLTTGEGGAITTNSKEIFERIKLLRSHGRLDTSSYFSNPSEPSYLNVGYNWRMSSITAALGISQLGKLDKIIALRKKNAKLITSGLSKLSSKIIFPFSSEKYENIYQMYTIRLKNKHVRDKLHEFLIKKKIFSKVYFQPIHLTQFYKSKFQSNKISLPVTELISEQVLTLPLYPNMAKEEIEYLIDSIYNFFEIVD
jgi:perosamine synthetase